MRFINVLLTYLLTCRETDRQMPVEIIYHASRVVNKAEHTFVCRAIYNYGMYCKD